MQDKKGLEEERDSLSKDLSSKVGVRFRMFQAVLQEREYEEMKGRSS